MRYDWIDSLSFTGGFIDILMLFLALIFNVCNYKMNEAKIMQTYEEAKAKSMGKKYTYISKLIQKNENWISMILLYCDIKK